MDLRLVTECKYNGAGGLTRYENSLIESIIKNCKIKPEVCDISEIKKPVRLSRLFNLFFPPKKINRKKGITHVLTQQIAFSFIFLRMQNVVITVHDLAFIIPKYFKPLPMLDKIRYWMVIKGLKRAERIIVDAEYTKKEILRYVKIQPSKIDVVPLGIDHNLFKIKKLGKNRMKYRDYEGSKIILYVGSEIPRMNFMTLVKAFYELKKAMPSVKLLKVGKSKCAKERIRIDLIIRELGLEKDIKFIEEVSEEDLAGYYNSADLFVYPIEYTGFGMPPLEAMACGCPVVCSNGSCLPEVVGDAALLFDPENIRQLKDCMYKALNDNRFRKMLIKKGLRWSSLFSWEKCAKQTVQIYEKFYDELQMQGHNP